MPQINISINGRSFPMTCGAGEEGKLKDLARYVDSHVANHVQNVGQVGDARLFLMAALTIAAELGDAVGQLEDMQSGLAMGEEASASLDQAARLIDTLADKIEADAQISA